MRLFFPATDHRQRFPEATDAEFGDWRWQQRHVLDDEEKLSRRFSLAPEERLGIAATRGIFRFGITPYYAALMDQEHFWCPVRRQAIPLPQEATARAEELVDPLGEDRHRPVPAIVHRYPDRVLLLALDRCAVYCRHCTRRRLTGHGAADFDREALDEAVAYVRAHPRVRDVLVSGGDPLLLSTERLARLVGDLRSIPHVELIRVGTRVPVCNPFRVDDELARALRRAEAFVVTHFNHPKELTAEAKEACERLVDSGVPVENQTVLLRRLNSSARIIADLNHRLLRLRVRPYYLHQGDLAQGLDHLRTPLSKGVEILKALRGHTSGLAVPHLAVDLPGGGGKVTLQPSYLVSQSDVGARFRNYLGETYDYPEPLDRDCSVPYESVFYGEEGREPERPSLACGP